MSVLVTGGAGYIGSVTVELLRRQGECVVVIDNLSRGHRTSVAGDIPFYQGDVGDRALVRSIVREHGIDSCVHFAAYAYVGESVDQPALYYENNVVQGLALLDELVAGGVTRFVFSSSCATYGIPQSVPILEDAPQSPSNPYGWTKLFLERVLDSYAKSYELNFVALRYFNAGGASGTCGERHEPETHLIPNVLAAAAGELPYVTIHGNDYPTKDGTAVRDYIHVEDLAVAHIKALAYLREGGRSEFINLGNGQGFSVLEVVETAQRVTQRPVNAVFGPRRAGDPPALVARAEKAQQVLGWRPTHTTLEGIIDSAWRWRTEGCPKSEVQSPKSASEADVLTSELTLRNKR
ncbi:MAG: UDP-glucose 4-epimerase [Acidobacteriota bacterium]|jgi:UDP-glucose 4-epimerase|nr:UDP-glucose 4-epimerase [Acidobacteriota bacterium]